MIAEGRLKWILRDCGESKETAGCPGQGNSGGTSSVRILKREPHEKIDFKYLQA